MPNFDAGHYFLTVLAPIRLDPDMQDNKIRSRRHMIREKLTAMPSGERTVASRGVGENYPFARNAKTHFARFFVLDDVVFNGRVSGDSLLDRLSGSDPLDPQPVDRLSTPFLIFVADFDAQSAGDNELNAYLSELWTSMGAELTAIFRHCVGFEAVKTAQDFCVYIKKCQIETTMPFNDYWSAAPALKDITLLPYLIGAGTGAVLILASLFYGGLWLIAGLLVLILSAVLGYLALMHAARLAFPISSPPAPGPDLPAVLKSLYVQRAFTALAIDVQGESDQQLYDKFGAFLAATQPNDLTAPTQSPGVIGV